MLINSIIIAISIAVLFLLGYTTQAFKKTVSLIVNIMLNIATFFGINITQRERTIKVSNQFKNTYKGIKMVKRANKNLKEQSSIDWLMLSICILSCLLVIINLNMISGNAISKLLYQMLSWLGLMSVNDANVLFTATMFSIISFSLTKVLTRWKDTKQFRKEKKEQKIKKKALEIMTSKELLTGAKEIDAKNYLECKK